MATKTQIVNLALLRIGVSQTISGDVDTSTAREALSANIFWDDERKFVLRDFPWPFARKYATLSLVEGDVNTPSNPDWIYAYAYPEDCLQVRRLVTCAGRLECSPPPFVRGRSDDGAAWIFTNLGDAMAEYTVDITDTAEFDQSFTSMLAWRLAAQLAPSLSRSAELAKQCFDQYSSEKNAAIARALAEGEYQIPSGDADPRTRDIFNLALTRLGISRNLVATDPELTFAALWPRVCFGGERDYVLQDFPWPWATEYVSIDAIAGSQTDPVNGDWTWAFAVPEDALFIRRIVGPGGRKETNFIPFRIGRGITNPDAAEADQVTGRLIYTNYASSMEIEYTLQITDPNEFDAMFMSLLAWRLAALLAPSIAKTKTDVKIVDRCFAMYEIEKSKVQRAAMNEGQGEELLDAEWIRGRS